MNYAHKLSNEEFLETLTLIVLANLEDEKFGVEELVEKSGFSHDLIRHRLRIISKKTISQFISEVRLKEAMKLLEEETLTAAEISYKVGFGSPAYFNKCFHEFFGYPPGEFKRRSKWKHTLGTGNDADFETIGIKKKGYLHHFSLRWDKVFLITGISISLFFMILTSYFLISGDSPFKRVRQWNDNRLNHKEKSILVLPFSNNNSDPNNQYLVSGLVEDILTKLSSINDLSVISYSTAQQFSKTKLTVPEIARKLDVRYVMSGSVQKIENTILIRVQLIDALTDSHIWTGRFERELTDIFDILNDISTQVADSLKANVSPVELKRVKKSPTKNPEAYTLYLKGRFLWDRRTQEALEKSIIHFWDAVSLDPEYALAYAGLADAYFIQAWWGWYKPREMGYAKAKTYALQALAIDKSLAEAHTVKGALLGWDERKWKESLKELKLAIELNPNNSDAHQYFAEILHITNQLDKAIKEIEIASELDPTSLMIHSLSQLFYYEAGDYKKAIKACLEAKEIDNTHTPVYWKEFNTFDELGEKENASAELYLAIKFDPNALLHPDSAIIIYTQTGKEGLLTKMIEKELKRPHPRAYQLASWYGMLKSKEATLTWLRKATELKEPEAYRLLTNPAFKFIYGDPRFISIVKEMELYPFY